MEVLFLFKGVSRIGKFESLRDLSIGSFAKLSILSKLPNFPKLPSFVPSLTPPLASSPIFQRKNLLFVVEFRNFVVI